MSTSGRHLFFNQFRQRSFLNEKFSAVSYDWYSFNETRFNKNLKYACDDWRRNDFFLNSIKLDTDNVDSEQLLSLWKTKILRDRKSEDSNPFLIFLSRRTRQHRDKSDKTTAIYGLHYALAEVAIEKGYHINNHQRTVSFYHGDEHTLYLEEKVDVIDIMLKAGTSDQLTFTNDNSPMLSACVRYEISLNPLNNAISCKCTDLVIEHHCRKAREVFDTRSVMERFKDWFKWFLGMNKMSEIKEKRLSPTPM